MGAAWFPLTHPKRSVTICFDPQNSAVRDAGLKQIGLLNTPLWIGALENQQMSAVGTWLTSLPGHACTLAICQRHGATVESVLRNPKLPGMGTWRTALCSYAVQRIADPCQELASPQRGLKGPKTALACPLHGQRLNLMMVRQVLP